MQVDRIDPAFGNWFAGFVDGEGCFYIRHNITRYRGVPYPAYAAAFRLGLRDDDRAIIEAIQAHLGMGTITTHRPQTERQRPAATFAVYRKADIVQLAEFFLRFPLRSKKARDFEVWHRAVIEWQRERGAKTRGRDWSVMAALHQELKDVRKYIPE